MDWIVEENLSLYAAILAYLAEGGREGDTR